MGHASSLPGRTPDESVTTMVQIVGGADLNGQMILFGGALMNWMDVCATYAARRHARSRVVTAGLEDLRFYASARADDGILLKAKVIYVGRTSLEVFVSSYREDFDGTMTLLADARGSLVALGDDGRPRPIPPLLPMTEQEIADFEAAKARRAAKAKKV